MRPEEGTLTKNCDHNNSELFLSPLHPEPMLTGRGSVIDLLHSWLHSRSLDFGNHKTNFFNYKWVKILVSLAFQRTCIKLSFLIPSLLCEHFIRPRLNLKYTQQIKWTIELCRYLSLSLPRIYYLLHHIKLGNDLKIQGPLIYLLLL